MPAVALRSIYPQIPKDESEREMLKEDLTRMGYAGLLERPWVLRSEGMVAELLTTKSNEWEGTYRQDPKRWTPTVWQSVYNLPKGGKSWATRGDRYVEGKFNSLQDPKDGLAVADCKDASQKRVLEFLVPIVYLEKPSRLTLTIGNTIFGSMLGKRRVD